MIDDDVMSECLSAMFRLLFMLSTFSHDDDTSDARPLWMASLSRVILHDYLTRPLTVMTCTKAILSSLSCAITQTSEDSADDRVILHLRLLGYGGKGLISGRAAWATIRDDQFMLVRVSVMSCHVTEHIRLYIWDAGSTCVSCL